MRKLLLITSAIIFITFQVFADDLVPATSDDVADFDRQVATHESGGVANTSTETQGKSADHRKDADHSKNDKSAQKDNFGAIVSAEAHRLKEEGLNGKQKMGPWVSGQRRKNDQNLGVSGGSDHGGSGGSRGDDARSSAPSNIDHGGTSGDSTNHHH
jgi:hypothetical protein